MLKTKISIADRDTNNSLMFRQLKLLLPIKWTVNLLRARFLKASRPINITCTLYVLSDSFYFFHDALSAAVCQLILLKHSMWHWCRKYAPLASDSCLQYFDWNCFMVWFIQDEDNSPATHQCGPPQGDWLGPWSQADLQSPGNDSSVYSLFSLFFRLFIDGADTTSSSKLFQMFTILSEKKWRLRSVKTRFFCNFSEWPLVLSWWQNSKKLLKFTVDNPWMIL